MHTTQKPYIILVQGFDQKTIKVLSRIISQTKLLQKIYNIENIKDRKDCVYSQLKNFYINWTNMPQIQ